MPRLIPAPLKRRFRQQLLRWYRKNGRELPWRETADPYSILVSEVMLQQTQVDRVIPKYHEFLSKYPTLQVLAKARARDVKKTWYPLGYNIRPTQLHSIAREIVAHYGGQLPSSDEELQSFKGIGRYTSGAIRSFAFKQERADSRYQCSPRAPSCISRQTTLQTVRCSDVGVVGGTSSAGSNL